MGSERYSGTGVFQRGFLPLKVTVLQARVQFCDDTTCCARLKANAPAAKSNGIESDTCRAYLPMPTYGLLQTSGVNAKAFMRQDYATRTEILMLWLSLFETCSSYRIFPGCTSGNTPDIYTISFIKEGSHSFPTTPRNYRTAQRRMQSRLEVPISTFQ